METNKIIENNYHSCTIRAIENPNKVTVYVVKHNLTNMELHLFGFAESLRAAKLLNLEYVVTNWYNFG